jgi:2-polyprenyl-6-methoxyphenol hydroxylase-like FAD-dependent oxidoreductase
MSTTRQATSERRIGVVGAGLSGLALANLLRSSHEVTVFERDRRLDSSGRTVRVHCHSAVNDVAAALLPSQTFELFVAGQGSLDARHIYVDPELKLLGTEERALPEVVLDTATTREILASGLDDALQFSADVRSVRVVGDKAVIQLVGGTTADVDLCVLASGGNNQMGDQIGFSPRRKDVGLLSLYGLVDLREEPEFELPDIVHDGFVIADDGTVKITLGLYAPRPALQDLVHGRRDNGEIRIRHYVFWNVVAPVTSYPGVGTLEWWKRTAVLDVLAVTCRKFPPWFHRLFSVSQEAGFGVLPLQTSSPGPLRSPDEPIILIGDAAHPMLPAALSTRAALEDALVLGKQLNDASRQGNSVLFAAAASESVMRDVAFKHVKTAEAAAGPAFGIGDVLS